jgi:hypothetical protein
MFQRRQPGKKSSGSRGRESIRKGAQMISNAREENIHR